MGFRIEHCVPHKQKDGGRAVIKFIDGDMAFGRDANGTARMWAVPSGKESNDFYSWVFDIVGLFRPDAPAGWEYFDGVIEPVRKYKCVWESCSVTDVNGHVGNTTEKMLAEFKGLVGFLRECQPWVATGEVRALEQKWVRGTEHEWRAVKSYPGCIQ